MDRQTRMLLTALPISALAVLLPCDAQTIPKQGRFDVTYEAVGSVVQSIDAGGGQSVNLAKWMNEVARTFCNKQPIRYSRLVVLKMKASLGCSE
jgi:hypothetical protein